MNLAIFDLDHTLIDCDSGNQWALFMREQGRISDEDLATNERFHQDYVNGCLNLEAFLEFQLRPLVALSPKERQALHRQFMQRYIRPHIHPDAQNLVHQHRLAGDELLLISATNEYIIRPIAQAFGISHSIGTALEIDPTTGHYTGRIHGTPSFREGKIARLHQWLQARGQTLDDYAQRFFYSDSLNDLPLLSHPAITHPVATNPDDTLRTYAQEHHWPILQLFPQT